MKFLVLLFLIGFASAGFYDVFERASEELVADFLVGMEKGPSLAEALDTRQYSEEILRVEEDIKNELGKTLQETLDQVLQRIWDAVEHGRQVRKDLADKAKEIAAKLKELGFENGSKAKELLERIKEKASDWLKSLLERLGVGKRSLEDFSRRIFEQLDIESLLQKLKENLVEKINLDGIKVYVKKLFGEFSAVGKTLLEALKGKGVQALKDLVARVISGQGSEYALKDAWEKIKDFFRDLKGQISEKMAKFAEWVKETVKSGFDNAKEKAERLKVIAREVIEKSKTMTKEAAREALEFFRPYKEDLGALWDQLKNSVKGAITGSDDF